MKCAAKRSRPPAEQQVLDLLGPAGPQVEAVHVDDVEHLDGDAEDDLLRRLGMCRGLLEVVADEASLKRRLLGRLAVLARDDVGQDEVTGANV